MIRRIRAAIARRKDRRRVAAQIHWGLDYIHRTYGGTPVVVPHIDFETPTGNPLAEIPKGFGLVSLMTKRNERP